MANIPTGAVHHFCLTVSDRNRARDFYTSVLNFQFLTEFGPKYLLSNNAIVLALSESPDRAKTIPNDRFDENRIGLDHICFSVPTREDMERAAELLDQEGIPHGPINDLEGLGIYVMSFRDPDNVQLEITAPR